MSRMADLPIQIHSVRQVRALDHYAIERLGFPGYALMTRAGEAAFAALRSSFPAAVHYLVVCGFGNNAGDGYVVARLALLANLRVTVVALHLPEALTGDARRAWEDFKDAGGTVEAWNVERLTEVDVIVDAIFGTGLSRVLEARLCACVNALNQSGKPIFSLDVPSGLDADTGRVLGAAVCAERTITFVGLKQGFYLADGPDHVGTIMFDGLDIPGEATAQVGWVAERLTDACVKRALPRRRRTSHKGQHGHVLIVGGGPGMAGAVRLAGEACLRVGAGLVTVVTHPQNAVAIVAGRPELMCRGVATPADLQPLLAAADVVAVGPGLGRDGWAAELLDAVLTTAVPLIVDADALNLLAQRPIRRDDWILTPHPGEAARLLGSNTTAVQVDRLGSLRQLVSRYGGTVVLKGAGTLIGCAESPPAVCDRGNPGMAVPGMGDVLTGVIAGIAAQCRQASLAAQAGVYVHATAGDMAARHGERGLLASDLFTYLPACVNP